ncbi:unnamed protein product [Acanthoscelides obtectus]|uniref:Uncharacterized protein n=1 Tax=Acanthoscelides obtectus TaxID=200917 RepID=A0A9P0KDR7_ACAOB|nr:unnamed protein product [Acanthoscelides obtectus]CAK1651079.1 hypothetical protein AOBTE_LOCUS17042 [Acanthoscelides obtectus]
MAAMARRREPADADDIAAIAKQISDQAEAIYQNWKSRGLGPSDLLSCHAAGDTAKLGSMLKPSTAASKPSIDLLVQAPTMDNNHLEKLVKNFVDEDKARIAAARGGVKVTAPLRGGATSPIGSGGVITPPLRSPVISPVGGGIASPTGCGTTTMSSSIQYALQKFERRGSGDGDTSLTKVGVLAAKKVVYGGGGAVTSAVDGSTQQSPKPAIGQKPQISPKPFQRLSPQIGAAGDTVEMTLPPDLAPTTPTSTPASSAGLQTWPLKNRVISTDAVKKTSQDAQKRNSLVIIGGDAHGQKVIESQKGLSIDHQVALEEKKLINALKNGDIVNEEAPKTSGKVTHVITVNGRDSNREVTVRFVLAIHHFSDVKLEKYREQGMFLEELSVVT